MVKRILGILWVLSSSVLAQGENSLIKDSVFLEISKPGFEVLSKVAQEKLLKSIENQAISDLKFSLPLVANLGLKNITFSAQFEKIRILPFSNGLDIEIGIRNLEIRVGEVRFSNYFLPGLGTSCFDTKISIANGKVLPIRAKLGIRMENGLVKFKNKGFDFYLDGYQYHTTGPANCHGTFGLTDRITSFFAQKLLTYARPAVNLGLNAGVDLLATDLGAHLFSQLERFKLPLKIPNLLIIPERQILLSFKIQNVQINSEKMKLVLALNVEKDNDKSDTEDSPEILKYATVGINPDFLTRLLGVVTPGHGTRPLEVTADFHEMVEEILKISEFSTFIPDLKTLKTDSDILRLFISFKKPPVVAIFNGKLQIEIPDLEMKVMVEKDGKWMDYTFLHLKTSFLLNLKIQEDKIVLGIELKELTLTNQFASTYEPTDTTFLHTEFADALKAIVELFTDNDDGGMKLDLPSFIFDNKKITIGAIYVRAPFLFLEIVGHSNF